jgi:hypothetical protein
MARFVVKEVYGAGKGGPYYVHDADGEYADSPKDFRLKRTAERYAARMQKKADQRRGKNPMAKKRKKRRSSAKHRKNPKQLLFRSKKAARAYAKAHGAKKFSIRKLKKGR